MRLLWKQRQYEAPVRRPDYTAIAVLEYDIFGIEPKPGTAAAAMIGMRSLAAVLRHQAHVGPEFGCGSGLIGRPNPYLMEAGESIRPLKGTQAPGSGSMAV